MPIALSCDCGKQLRVPDEHLGKRIRCPSCGEALLVEQSRPSKAPAKKPAAAAPSAAAGGMLTFACSCGKKMQAKAEYAGRSVKCPECGEGVQVPKAGGPARKPAADEDDAPVSKRLDGLLAKKKAAAGTARGRDDDDDDDRPTRSRRAADDDYDDPDDEDDRPKKGKKAKKGKKGGSMMPWLLVGGGVLALVIVGLVVMFFFMGGGASGDMALVPGNAAGFVTVRVADALATDAGKEAMAELPPQVKGEIDQMDTKLGFKLADIERLTVVLGSLDAFAGAAMGGGMGRMGEPDMYVVISTSKPVDQKKVLESAGMGNSAGADHNGKKIHSQGSNAVYFHSDKTIIAGPPNGVRKAIDQAVKPKTDGPLAKVTSQVGRQHVVAGFGMPPQVAPFKAQAPPEYADLMDIQQFMVTANVAGKTLEVEVTGMLPDSGKAGKAKEALDGVKAMAGLMLGGPNVPAPARDALNNLTVSQSGSNVVLATKAAIDMATLKGALANAGGIGGGGGGPIGDAADRTRDQNNLKQIALAFHNLHDTTMKMPWALTNPQQPQNRTPLHSWRVAILPFVEQDNLYKQLKLNEPWNSPHNSRFHNMMPKLFEVPGRSAPQGQTYYQVFVGQGAIFDRNNPQGKRLTEITDGSSNTLLVVEGAQSVNWMEPKDITFTGANFRMQGNLGGRFPAGFNAAFADGSVRFLPRTLPQASLNGAITAAGNEIVNLP